MAILFATMLKKAPTRPPATPMTKHATVVMYVLFVSISDDLDLNERRPRVAMILYGGCRMLNTSVIYKQMRP